MFRFVKIINLSLCVLMTTLTACARYGYKADTDITKGEKAVEVESVSASATLTQPFTIAENESITENTSADASAGNTMYEYIFPNSGSDRLSYKNDLLNKTDEELRIGRNEIYARHGRRFTDTSLQSYFDSKDWYQGTIAPKEFDYSSISGMEQINIDAIAQVEWQRKIAGDAKTYTYRYDRTEYSDGETFVHPEYKEYFLDIISTDLDHITVRGQEIQNNIQEFTRSDLDYDGELLGHSMTE